MRHNTEKKSMARPTAQKHLSAPSEGAQTMTDTPLGRLATAIHNSPVVQARAAAIQESLGSAPPTQIATGRPKPTLQLKGTTTIDAPDPSTQHSYFPPNFAVPPVLQRRLLLDEEKIPKLNLKAKRNISEAVRTILGNSAIISGEGWNYIEELIEDDEKYEYSTEELAADLVTNEMTFVPEKKQSHAVSVHVQHGMPKASGVFSKATQRDVPVRGGEHRRHVIGRHTLGRACDASKDAPASIKGFIKEYGTQSDKTKADDRKLPTNIKSVAYRILQDHTGNLWAGAGGENTAIGFFTSDIYTWFDKLVKKKNCKYKEAVDSLDAISNFAFAKFALDDLKSVVKEGLKQHKGTKRDPEALRIDGALSEFILDIAKNCELDLPKDQMDTDYNQEAIDLFNRFATSRNIFSDGTAEEFMQLDLHERKAPKPRKIKVRASPKKVTSPELPEVPKPRAAPQAAPSGMTGSPNMKAVRDAAKNAIVDEKKPAPKQSTKAAAVKLQPLAAASPTGDTGTAAAGVAHGSAKEKKAAKPPAKRTVPRGQGGNNQ